MTGHEMIIEMRKRHKRPKSVWVWLGINPLSLAALWPDLPDFWAFPEVDVDPKDTIEALDLRFLVGLQVHIDGNDTRERLLKMHRQVSLAGAESVFTMVDGNLIYNPGVKRELSTA